MNDFDLISMRPKVMRMLESEPGSRDSDRLLIHLIWMDELAALKEPCTVAQALVEGKISHPESIRRTRQKVQQHHPKLRGAKYSKRHKLAGAVAAQLYFDFW